MNIFRMQFEMQESSFASNAFLIRKGSKQKSRPQAEFSFKLVGDISSSPCERIFGGARPRKLHIVRFRASMETHSLRCSSSPRQVLRLAGIPLLRLFFFLLSFLLRLGFRIFDAEQAGQICLIGQQLAVLILDLVVFCVCSLFVPHQFCVLCPQSLQ